MTKYEIQFKNENGEMETKKIQTKYRKLCNVKAQFELAYQMKFNKKVKVIYISEL